MEVPRSVSWLLLPAPSRALLPLLWGTHRKVLPKIAINSLAGYSRIAISDPGFFFPQMDNRTLRPLSHTAGELSGSWCLFSILGFWIRFPLKQGSENHAGQETFPSAFPRRTLFLSGGRTLTTELKEWIRIPLCWLSRSLHSLEAELLGSKRLKWVPLHRIKI